MRRLSYSELAQALTCQAKWDFSYGGRLTGGDTLRSKALRPILSGGRAWGAAMAVWHSDSSLLGQWNAHRAILDSLDKDAEQSRRDFGIAPDLGTQTQMATDLGAMFDHYIVSEERLPNLTRVEDELLLPVPALAGEDRASHRYFFHGFLDGFTVDDHGHEWLVEFKLRKRLSRQDVLIRSRQIRWYAWARQHETDRQVVGVIVDERLNEIPQPPRVLQDGKLSHAADQATTADLYVKTCEEQGVEPRERTVEALRARKWGQRITVQFRRSELLESGRELRSAARLIRDLDAGDLYPIRNASNMNCNFCDYRAICDEPHDSFYIDTLFNRRPPKRELT